MCKEHCGLTGTIKTWALPALLAAFFQLFFCAGLQAATVSVLIAEEGSTGVKEYSLLWENGMMDVFFDTGHIVSNAPVLQLDHRGEKKLPDEARKDFGEAASSGAEFFILALLDYRRDAAGREKEKPEAVLLRLFKVQSGEMLYEEQLVPKSYGSRREEVENIRDSVRKLIPHFKAKNGQ